MDSNKGTRTKFLIVVAAVVRGIQGGEHVTFLNAEEISALNRSEVSKTTDGDDLSTIGIVPIATAFAPVPDDEVLVGLYRWYNRHPMGCREPDGWMDPFCCSM